MKWMILLLAVSSSAHAAPAEPKAVVQEIFARASAPEVATDVKKQAEVNAFVDFDALAKAALGKQFKATPPAEFQWFRDTLREIIGRTVYPKAPEFLSGVKITYSSDEAKDGRAKVKSTVQNKADLTDVDYQLASEKGGDWKVVDVAISGQSWVESIRDQVNNVIKKKKWKGLKDSMNRRLNELKSGKA
ncbi:MAG: ABC transporter substrate-binding protein [Bdellovibrionota bacterium]